MTQLPYLRIQRMLAQVTQTCTYINVHVRTSNPWKSNHRDGSTGHKNMTAQLLTHKSYNIPRVQNNSCSLCAHVSTQIEFTI